LSEESDTRLLALSGFQSERVLRIAAFFGVICSLLELDSLAAYSWYTLTITVGWGVTPCSPSGNYEYFGGTFCLHLERTLLREHVEFFVLNTSAPRQFL